MYSILVGYLVDERMDTEGYAEENFQGLSVCAIPLSYWDLDDRSDTEDLTEGMFHGLTVCLEPLSFILDGRFDAEDLTEEFFHGLTVHHKPLSRFESTMSPSISCIFHLRD